jgi:membrane-associated phospholipid phosphatase
MDLTVRLRHRSLRVTRRGMLFAALSVAFLLLTLGVALKTPLLRLDTDVVDLHLRERWPGAFDWVNTYVMLGQRAPSTLLALPWFIWRAWRSRSWRPLVTLGVALVLLNLGVGFVKVATGRLGPLRTDLATAVFRGGDIYPSGHVSNAVVLYGAIAMLAVGHRRLVTAMAVFVSVTVGLSTIYLDTHWLTDVLGGWLAGGMVLLAVPTLVPPVERGLHRLRTLRPRAPRFEPPTPTAPVPVPLPMKIPVQVPQAAPVPAADSYAGAGGAPH